MLSEKIVGIILAAGESGRMGSPKALLNIGERTFIQRIVENLKEAGIDNIIVVLGHQAELILSKKEQFDIKFVINEDYKKGQLSSIQTGIKSLPENVDGIVVWPVDRPLVSSGLVKKLIKKFIETKAPVVVPIYQAQRGHPIIFSADVFPEILRAPQDVGARAVVWAHHNEIAEVQTNEEGILINIDTPKAYNEYIENEEYI